VEKQSGAAPVRQRNDKWLIEMTEAVPLTIALSKGRIYKDALPLLAHAGIVPEDDPETSRKLILATNQPEVKLLIVRATDVPTYVDHGAADVGITGKDVLNEYRSDGLYEPMDLKIAQCRLVVAGPANKPSPVGQLRIATKYVRATLQYYAAKGEQVKVIKLYGSMELAPLLGLADRIVDLVDTGNTLRANGLVEMEHIVDISSRLIVNKAALKMKNTAIKSLMAKISQVIP